MVPESVEGSQTSTSQYNNSNTREAASVYARASKKIDYAASATNDT